MASNVISIPTAHAGNTWDGGSAVNGNWTDGSGTPFANWDTNTAPVAGTLLTFGGNLQTASNNNLFLADESFNGITFASGAGAFTLTGSRITLGNSVTNSSISLQAINLDLIVAADRTFTSTTGNMAVGGVISGAGGVIKGGAGTTLTLSGTNTFTGTNGVRVNAGVLSFNTIGNLSTSSAIGAATTFSVNNLQMVGGTMQYTGATASSNRGWRTGVVAGNVFDVTQAGTNLTISGLFSDGSGTAGQVGIFTKTGLGTLTLTGHAADINLNVGVIVNQGILNLSGSVADSNGRFASAVVNTGGTLQLGGNANQMSPGASTAAGSVTVNAGGTLDLLTSQSFGTLSTSDTGGTVTTSTTGTKTITSNGTTSDYSFGGLIQNGSGVVAITKSGAGTTLTLTNANTHSGTTLLSRGSIAVGNNSALGTGTFTMNNSTAAETVRIRSTDATARTLANPFGTFGGTTSTYAFGAISGGTGNLTFSNSTTASIGTGARTFQIDNAVTEFNMGFSGTGGSITKTGDGTMILKGTSTYSGGSTISAGTLLVNNTTNSGTGAGSVSVTGGVLGGTGTISGATTIGASGTLSPTAQASNSKLTINNTLTFASGSIFDWDLTTADKNDPGDQTNFGNYGQVSATGATGSSVFNITLLGGGTGTDSYADAFWNTNKSWTNILTATGLTDFTTLFTSFSGTGLTASGSDASIIATAAGEGHFSFTSTSLNWTAVPEPTSALAGLLLGAGLLRRRRKA